MAVLRTFLTILVVGLTALPTWSAATPEELGGREWWERVRAGIALSEYEVAWQPGAGELPAGWQAPNRAQGLRARFDEFGVRLEARTDAAGSWSAGFDLLAYGRPGSVAEVAGGLLSVEGARIVLRRGAIEEWFHNEARGIEHGFRLGQAPQAGIPGAHPATLELEVHGDLTPAISVDGRAIAWIDPAGARVLHHGSLTVVDALDQAVAGRFELRNVEGRRLLRIAFADEELVSPVTIKMLLTAPAWNGDGDQFEAHYGWSVATAGDVNGDGYSDVIVGARLFDAGQTNEGRAFVYHGSPAGPSIVADWTGESNDPGARFGVSVATAGDVNGDGYSDVIVGARSYSSGEVDEGGAFVYHGSAAGLAEVAAWIAESDQAGANFGRSVGAAGDINGDGYSDVIVGASAYDGAHVDEGRAWVYLGSAAGLSPTSAFTTFGGQASAELGWSVGWAGDVNADGFSDIIIGARSWNGSFTNEGRAVIFLGSASGLGFAPSWTVDGEQGGARFGEVVGNAGDVNGDGYSDVIVGAPLYDDGEIDEGAAFVFLGGADGPDTVSDWVATGQQLEANLGIAAATAGDVNSDGYADVIVGANLYDDGEEDEGRAAVYTGSAAGLATEPAWAVHSDQPGAEMGWSAFTAGDVNGDGHSDVIVGGRFHDGAFVDEGRAWVYGGSPDGLSLVSGWFAESDQGQSDFGIAIAAAGDVNGDGYDDVLVGARFYDAGSDNEGRAYIFHGSPDGLEFENSGVADIDQASAQFGAAVGSAGDVNGDGYADVIVGAPRFNDEQSDEGAAYLYTGSASGLSMFAVWSFEPNQARAHAGSSVGSAGDVNGDGFSDLVIGADSFDDGETDEGAAFVFYGSPTGPGSAPDWIGGSNQTEAFGGRGMGAGDVNGDGYSDLIVGAHRYTGNVANEGAAFVYHGSPSGLSAVPAWFAYGGQQDASFGFTVAGAGDVNGDGYSDVIVGAPLYSGAENFEGAAFVYLGSPTGLAPVSSWSAMSGQENARAGLAVETAGDVNGDGYSDVVVGMPLYDDQFEDEGRTRLYHGSAAGLGTTPAWFVDGGQAFALAGRSAARAGDVDGDGYSDLAIGAPTYSNEEFKEGAAFLFYGNQGPGMNRRPAQRRSDDSVAIHPLGITDTMDGFLISLTQGSPAGRTAIGLEWEVLPLGVPFDGSTTGVSGMLTELETPRVTLTEAVSGLAAATPYHWRVRPIYGTARSPYQSHGPWITGADNGWAETDLRTPLAGAGSVPDGTGGTEPLRVEWSDGELLLTWGASCSAEDDGYLIYVGSLGQFDSHVPFDCEVTGGTALATPPPFADAYYLVVPVRGSAEGAYGEDSTGLARPASQAACFPQSLGICDVE